MYIHTLTHDYHTLHYCCTDKCCLPRGTHLHTSAHTHTFTDKWLAPEGLPIQSNPTNTLNFHFKQKANPHTDTTKSVALLPLSLSRSFIVPVFSLSFSFKLNHLFLLHYLNHFGKRMKCDEQKTSMTEEGDC